ncbi:MAG: hypothetical protein ACKVY0_27345 [Prosthecobacter sp.]|uniref:hypothetical protein n=1 Tax=Prosthecobacter sp. TaxID=1965333 RepID=UPI003903CF95
MKLTSSHAALPCVASCFLVSMLGFLVETSAVSQDLCVEVYELPQANAYALQKVFLEGGIPDRLRVMDVLHSATPPSGVKLIAAAQCVSKSGTRVTFSSAKEYIYGIEFDAGQGTTVVVPTAFEMRTVGTEVEAELTGSQPQGLGFYLATVSVKSVDLTGKNPNPAAAGLVPIFISSDVVTNASMTAGVPCLLGMYAPHPDIRSGSVLRAVIATVPGPPAAGLATPQFDACVEVYEMPSAMAAAFKQSFDTAPEGARSGLLQQTRNKAAAGGLKTVAFGHRAFRSGVRSTCGSVKEFFYPTEFITPGNLAPASSVMAKLGCQMELEITAAPTGQTFNVTTVFTDTERLSPVKDTALKPDAKGLPVKPVFSTTNVNTTASITSGIPAMLSMYETVRGGGTSRLLFVTVHAREK